jgi:hypothetical protein
MISARGQKELAMAKCRAPIPISPFVGQLDGSDNHSAGQVEHPYGVWRTSKMNKPLLYVFFDSILTDLRPVVVSVSERSTLSTAELAEA